MDRILDQTTRNKNIQTQSAQTIFLEEAKQENEAAQFQQKLAQIRR